MSKIKDYIIDCQEKGIIPNLDNDNKLKTMNDLEQEFREDIASAFKYEVKKEAIKWIKDLRKTANNQEDFCMKCLKEVDCEHFLKCKNNTISDIDHETNSIYGAIEVLKAFHNIMEVDLE